MFRRSSRTVTSTGRPFNVFDVIVDVLLILAILSLAVGCSPRDGDRAQAPDTTTSDASAEPEAFFPKQAPAADDPGTIFLGKLVLDGRCLCVKSPEGVAIPVWRPEHELDASGKRLLVRDQKGRTIAKVGERVRMTGYEAGPSPRDVANVTDRRTARQLRERCSGTYYWPVGFEVSRLR